MSYRKEKKIRLTIFDYNKLKVLLIKKGFHKLYDKRQINSIYYDTGARDMFLNSEEGVLPRKKVRIRWYNSNNNFTFETKISSIEGRFKKTKNLNLNSITELPKSLEDQLYGFITPSLLVSYERSYFSLKGIRITFDDKIKYHDLRLSSSISFYDPERVIEVKANIDTSDDFIEELITYTTSRFSKYSRGLLIANSLL